MKTHLKNKNYKNLAINSLLVLGSIVTGFLLLEGIARPHHLPFKNFILQDGGDLVEHFFKKLYRYDPHLGWVPMSNVSMTKWGGRVSTLDDGIRSNGRDLDIDKNDPILAVGDSFTFGDGVSDENTWPSFLELLMHRKVYNAGVSSYGLDQVILRSEVMIKKYDPRAIVFSFIYDDTLRCIQKIRHGVPKPYFMIQNDQLVLHHQEPFYGIRFDLFRRIFGYSYVCHRIMSSLFPNYWWGGTTRDIQSVPGDSMLISRLLLDKFMELAQSRDVIFLVQGSIDSNESQEFYLAQLISYVEYKYPKAHVIFTVPSLVQLKNTDHQAFEDLFINDSSARHPSPRTNMILAQLVAKELMNKTK
jgi:hypothetical protein